MSATTSPIIARSGRSSERPKVLRMGDRGFEPRTSALSERPRLPAGPHPKTRIAGAGPSGELRDVSDTGEGRHPPAPTRPSSESPTVLVEGGAPTRRSARTRRRPRARWQREASRCKCSHGRVRNGRCRSSVRYAAQTLPWLRAIRRLCASAVTERPTDVAWPLRPTPIPRNRRACGGGSGEEDVWPSADGAPSRASAPWLSVKSS
jgi:hypothetical protein